MSAAITIDSLTKDYRSRILAEASVRALDRLSLEVQPGEIFGFLEPQRCREKTTTLEAADAADFSVLRPGGDSRTAGWRRRGRQRVGYPRKSLLYDYLSADELLPHFGHLFGYSRSEARARAARLLDRSASARSAAGSSSSTEGDDSTGGHRAGALNDPEVIFLDEPMSGLDPLGRRDVRALILRLRDQGRTVFFSSHILADAEALCSRVAVVAGGRLAATGRLSDMLAFEIRGWELVIADLRPEVLARIAGQLQKTTEISPQRYALELPLQLPPERILADSAGGNARLVHQSATR